MHLLRLGTAIEVEGLLKAAIATLHAKRAERVAAGGESDALACRALFRLAHFGDQLYRHAAAQMQSPEWATRMSVIAHKEEQVCSIRKTWQLQHKIKLAASHDAL
jgi:hypothetical protein